MQGFIPVNEPLLDGNEKTYLIECIDSGWISSEGPFVMEFENRFATVVGRKHAIAVANGTAAIDVAIESLDIGPGDEVILPTFTIISCLTQIVRAGAVPVLVDSDPLTWNMNVATVEKTITPKTKAIMIVHTYGLPVDVDPVLKLAKQYNLRIIEDAAEMHGQTYKGKPCGSFGDISIFSFYANKHITTGEGGMIVTDDDELAAACRSLRNLCFQSGKRFVHERLGWNVRMTNMQAAVGLAQIERLTYFVQRKRRIGALYTKLLSGLEGITLPLPATEYATNIYWIYGIVLDESSSYAAVEVMTRLCQAGVGTRPFFFPMHLQPVLLGKGYFRHQTFPVAERLSRQGFYLPSGMSLSESQIYAVSEKLISILDD